MAVFHRKLLNIAQGLTTKDDLPKLKYLCKQYIPAGQAEFITTPLGLFEELEKLDELSEDKPDFLAQCLIDIGRNDLKNKLLQPTPEKVDELAKTTESKLKIKQKSSRPLTSDRPECHEDVANVADSLKVTGSTPDLTDNQKRWSVVGICLNFVVLPPLRKFLEPNIEKHYTKLKGRKQNKIDKQVYNGQLVSDGRCSTLNYRSINNNMKKNNDGTKKKEKDYDYKVMSAIDLGKLYLYNMAKFTGFDNTCDLSAVLGILSSASVFSSDVHDCSESVREVRNEWAHCDVDSWDETKFKDSFKLMYSLLKALKLSCDDEKTITDQLADWEKKGVEMCMPTNTVSPELVKDINDRVTQLSQEFELALSRNEESKEEVCKILKTLKSVQDEIQERMGRFEERVGNVEDRVDGLDDRVKTLEAEKVK